MKPINEYMQLVLLHIHKAGFTPIMLKETTKRNQFWSKPNLMSTQKSWDAVYVSFARSQPSSLPS